MTDIAANLLLLFGVGSILMGQEHETLKPATISVWDGKADRNEAIFTLVLETRDGIAGDPGSWRHIRGIVVTYDHRGTCPFELGGGETLRDDGLSVQCQSGTGGRLSLTFKDKANEAVALWETGGKSIELRLLRRERIDPSALAGDWISSNEYRVCTVHVHPLHNPFINDLERFTGMEDQGATLSIVTAHRGAQEVGIGFLFDPRDNSVVMGFSDVREYRFTGSFNPQSDTVGGEWSPGVGCGGSFVRMKQNTTQ